MSRGWVMDPDSGGVPVPPAVRQRVADRIRKYADERYAGKFTRLDVRFRGVFCYIDAFTEPDEPSKELLKITRETRQQYLDRMRATPLHLCRLRFFGNEDRWSLGFYTYSNERYELCVFRSGDFYGPPEEAFEIGAMYL
ncbi:MAG TPA: hypothetical protein VFG68_07875 [Fimbriiglobus sp.]|nr:hypothetical protein [Fimbriiglobus sp.]